MSYPFRATWSQTQNLRLNGWKNWKLVKNAKKIDPNNQSNVPKQEVRRKEKKSSESSFSYSSCSSSPHCWCCCCDLLLLLNYCFYCSFSSCFASSFSCFFLIFLVLVLSLILILHLSFYLLTFLLTAWSVFVLVNCHVCLLSHVPSSPVDFNLPCRCLLSFVFSLSSIYLYLLFLSLPIHNHLVFFLRFGRSFARIEKESFSLKVLFKLILVVAFLTLDTIYF